MNPSALNVFVEQSTHVRESAPAVSMPADSPLKPAPSLAQLVGMGLPLPDAQVALKERRTYEVARQRVKHAEDRRKAREQKTKRGATDIARVRVTNVGVDVHEATEAAKAVVGAAAAQGKDEKRLTVQSGMHKATVRLEDLVRVAKVRKDKTGDFELVPHVRAVVVLDDSDFTGDVAALPDFDDWEHIESCSNSKSNDEGETAAGISKVPSYAQVVLASTH